MQKRPQCRQRPLPGRCEGVYGATRGVNHALVRVTRAAGGTWACCGEIGRSREHLRYQLSAADDDLTAHVTPAAAASHSRPGPAARRPLPAALPLPSGTPHPEAPGQRYRDRQRWTEYLTIPAGVSTSKPQCRLAGSMRRRSL